MAINTQDLFGEKCRRFGQSAKSTTFLNDFIAAVNRTLYEIGIRAGLSASAITSANDDVSLSAKYAVALSAGVDYHLLKMGQNSAQSLDDAYAIWTDALGTAQMGAFMDAETAETLEVQLGDLSD